MKLKKYLIWIVVIVIFFSIGIAIKLQGETINKSQEAMSWGRPVNLLEAHSCWCVPFYGIDQDTKEIVRWKIDGVVNFLDGTRWTYTIRIYKQSKKPVEMIDKNCQAWATFILQRYRQKKKVEEDRLEKERLEQKYIIHASALRREKR